MLYHSWTQYTCNPTYVQYLLAPASIGGESPDPNRRVGGSNKELRYDNEVLTIPYIYTPLPLN